jgi:hypothetical protein
VCQKVTLKNEPKTGRREEVRVKNEKSQFLGIVTVHSRELAARLCAFASLHLCVKSIFRGFNFVKRIEAN